MKKLLADDERMLEAHANWHWVIGAGVIAVTIGAAVMAQRDALIPPGSNALWVGLTVAPWLVDAVLYPTKRTGVPIWLFVPVVIAAVVALEMHPVENDMGPFFLVPLCAEMASRLAFAGGLVVLTAGLATMLGIEVWAPYDDSFVWFGLVAPQGG